MQSSSTTVSSESPRSTQQARARGLTIPRIEPVTIALIVMVLIGLALRIWFINLSPLDPRFSASDDGDYYQRALRLATTGEYLDNSWLIRPPGHIFFFAAVMKLSLWMGDLALTTQLIRVVHVGLSLLLIPLGYDLARRLFHRPAGLIFAGILTIWWPLVELPSLIQSEPLFFFTLTMHCWMLVRWRDAYHAGARRAWFWLVGAGLLLGYCALTRSPALYSVVFSLLFLAVEIWRGKGGPLRLWAGRLAVTALALLIPFASLIIPWTVRNYLTYGQMIMIDTTGPINLWLSLQDERIDGGKSVLAGMAQGERQPFASAEIREILRDDPLRLVRNAWPHFTHIWKAQFVEDFFVKVSFFSRPVREMALLGLVGDLIWMTFCAASLFAVTSRPHEGGFRLIALGWAAYSCLTVMLIHVEPRYLLPLWLFMALYGAAALGTLALWLARLRRDAPAARTEARAYLRTPWFGAGALLCLSFLVLVVTYRDYPQIISRGLERERHRAVAVRAQADGDYGAAIAAYEQMMATDPNFVDGRLELARLYLALGDYEQGWNVLSDRHTHRGDVVRAALARARGDLELAAELFTDAEVRAGEDVQQLGLAWLEPAPLTSLRVGNGLDIGYLEGFSFGETLPSTDTGPPQTYRWLEAEGRLILPLPEPLQEGDVVHLRMAGGIEGVTPLRVQLGSTEVTIPVEAGAWRVYRLAVPAELHGAHELEIRLSAPTFIPLQVNPTSYDARRLSVKVSDAGLE